MISRRFLLVAALCVLAACASREVLVEKSAAVPEGVDFSGTWALTTDLIDERRKLNTAVRRTDDVKDSDILRDPVFRDESQGRIRPRRVRGGMVHVFLTNGKTLKITQTAGGLFVSFDRAVVEEYRFGENRQVRVGPVMADRVSGWVGDDYVVETLDDSGMKLTERWSLSTDGDTLWRMITLRGKNMEEETVVQTFARAG